MKLEKDKSYDYAESGNTFLVIFVRENLVWVEWSDGGENEILDINKMREDLFEL